MTSFRQLFRVTLFFLGLFTAQAADKPNVLFIIADDMGVDAINGYGIGTDLPNTPHLDALRQRGVTFTNVWSAPVCAATRASLVTGKYGVNNGVNTLPGFLKLTQKSIFTEISERDSSYETCVVGKWHLGRKNNVNHPTAHGVGEFMGVLGNGVDDYYSWLKVENAVQDTCKDYATSYFTNYAIDWINEQADKPWLMWLAHLAPHTPYHDVPDAMATTASTGTVKNQFKRMIESLDYELGRLMDSIPEDVLANTVIMFLGDNGTPGNVIQGFAKTQAKETLYQGGINVPLIVSGKGVTREGETEDALINVSDFYVTITQLIDDSAFPENTANDGISFKHLLDGTDGPERELNYMELGANSTIPEDIYTTCNTQYKVIDRGTSGYEMYDLLNDPFETENLLEAELSADEAEIKSRLIAEMDAIRGFSRAETSDSVISEVGTSGSYPVVHTGVSEFADATSLITTPDISEDLYWQDAGRIINSPSYTDNGDGTVTDNVTGLMWQQDMGDKMSHDEAVLTVTDFDLGGYKDWRMPTIKELYSLILFSGRVFGETAQTHFIDTDYFNQPIGDTDAGEREIDAQTWSSTYYTSTTMNSDTTIFGVNFVDGRIKGYPKYLKSTGAANSMYFRFVRGNTDYGKNVFHNNNDGTVSDSATSLMWQQADDGVARDWEGAISYCEALSLAGYDDWHLPNAKELQSIVDYSRSPDATNSAAIDPLFSTTSISDAEGNPGHYPYFWSTSPHKDGNSPYSTAVYVAFGEAKGQMNATLMDVHGAGAQRSDPKSGDAADYPQYWGPQGDVRRVYNHCRCVRLANDKAVSFEAAPDHLFQLILFPNPSTGLVSVTVPEVKTQSSLEVYNIYGQLMLSKTFEELTSVVDLSPFESGIYLFVIRNNDGCETWNVLKR